MRSIVLATVVVLLAIPTGGGIATATPNHVSVDQTLLAIELAYTDCNVQWSEAICALTKNMFELFPAWNDDGTPQLKPNGDLRISLSAVYTSPVAIDDPELRAYYECSEALYASYEQLLLDADFAEKIERAEEEFLAKFDVFESRRSGAIRLYPILVRYGVIRAIAGATTCATTTVPATIAESPEFGNPFGQDNRPFLNAFSGPELNGFPESVRFIHYCPDVGSIVFSASPYRAAHERLLATDAGYREQMRTLLAPFYQRIGDPSRFNRLNFQNIWDVSADIWKALTEAGIDRTLERAVATVAASYTTSTQARIAPERKGEP